MNNTRPRRPGETEDGNFSWSLHCPRLDSWTFSWPVAETFSLLYEMTVNKRRILVASTLRRDRYERRQRTRSRFASRAKISQINSEKGTLFEWPPAGRMRGYFARPKAENEIHRDTTDLHHCLYYNNCLRINKSQPRTA